MKVLHVIITKKPGSFIKNCQAPGFELGYYKTLFSFLLSAYILQNFWFYNNLP